MPQAIIQAIATALGGAAYIGAATAIYYVATLVISYAMSQNQASKAKRKARDRYNANLEDRLVAVSTVNGARSRVYGRVRNVDGILFKGTYGPNKEKYVMVLALAGHEVDGIETVYFNEMPVGLAADGVALSDGRQGYWVQDAPYMQRPVVSGMMMMTMEAGTSTVAGVLPFDPIPGTVIVGYMTYAEAGGTAQVDPSSYTIVGRTVTLTVPMPVPIAVVYGVVYQYNDAISKARVWKFNGAPGQNIGQVLLASRFPGLISAADRFEGVACLVVELEYSQDAYPTGIPQISAVMRGAKVWDPRTGQTVWTENPALIALDWARHPNGGGVLEGEYRLEKFIAAANACDVMTEFHTVRST